LTAAFQVPPSIAQICDGRDDDKYWINTTKLMLLCIGIVQLVHRLDEENLVLLKGTASAVPKRAGPKALPLCRRLERSPKGEATDLLPLFLPLFSPLFLPLHLFFAFLAQKSHVKPLNHLTPSNKRK